jgi:hypothetical protein
LNRVESQFIIAGGGYRVAEYVLGQEIAGDYDSDIGKRQIASHI